jgi:CheY-like chemotaxis protein
MPSLLYVDPDLARWAEVQRLFANQAQAEVAFDGWAGFAGAVMHQPDMLLVELNVPVMSGIEMVRLLRTESACANLPIFGFGAQGITEEVREVALQAGFTQLVAFPFSHELPEQLLTWLPAKTD